MMNNKTIDYIIEFLVGKELSRFVSYGPQEGCSIVIVPSGWFEQPTMPLAPVPIFHGIPILFGEPKMEERDGRLLVYADFVASAYFLMSRYEELLNPVRDEHGRFPGKESVPCKNGFIDRPVVDEYGKWLRNLIRRRFDLDTSAEHKGISKIWLTHDVDMPFETRGLNGRLRDVASNLIHRHKFSISPIVDYCKGRSDPYTFPWLLEFDNSISSVNVEVVYFILARKDGDARDRWYLDDRRWPGLLAQFRKYGVTLGIHASYAAGGKMDTVADDVRTLAERLESTICYNRHHFLRMTDPSDFRYLEQAGITDDFSVGYADVAGFRVGTCRPHRWIDPRTGEIGQLTIHPMTIMECTLDNPLYMGMNRNDSYDYAKKLISCVSEFGGECVLLWHNTSLMPTECNWQRDLYVQCVRGALRNGKQ